MGWVISLEINLFLNCSLSRIHACCIFWPAFGCCALQTLDEIVIFSVFNGKKLKKQEIWSKILRKTRFLKFASKRWSTDILTSVWQFFIGKKWFFKEKAHFLGIKQSTSILVQTSKNVFFVKFCYNTCRSKYTTHASSIWKTLFERFF